MFFICLYPSYLLYLNEGVDYFLSQGKEPGVAMLKVIVLFVLLIQILLSEAVADIRVSHQDASNLQWLAHDYPPLSFQDPQTKSSKGLFVDLVVEMLKRLDIKASPDDISLVPWERGLKQLELKPHTALFPMVITEERKQRYALLNSKIFAKVGLFTLKSKGEEFAGQPNAVIGVVHLGIGEHAALKSGISNDRLVQASNLENLIHMLLSGRIMAVAFNQDVFLWKVKDLGMDPNQFQMVSILLKAEIGIAFPKSTPPKLLEQMQKTIDKMEKDGTIDRLKKKHLNSIREKATSDGR